MDYSYYYPSILFMYFGTFIGIFIGFIILAKLATSYIRENKVPKESVKPAGAIILTVCVVLLAIFSISFFKDIPNVINENYIVATGTVVSWDSGGTASETRGITLETDDGKRIKTLVNYTPIREGERYEIIYLPNTTFGSIIRQIEEDEPERG